MKDYSLRIIERRWAIVVTTILLAVAAIMVLPKLKVDADFFNYLPVEHPVVQNFQRLTAGFSRDTVMMVVESDDLFSNESMTAVWNINKEITEMKGIASVTSLANVASITTTDGGIEISPLLNKEALGRDPDFYGQLKEKILNDDHYKGVLVSDDGRFTTIVVNLAKDAQPDKAAMELKKIATKYQGKTKVHFAGTPMMMDSIEELLWGDMAVLVPLVVLLLVLVLYLSFKRLMGIWLPLVAVGLGTLLVLAIMAFCGVPMTMISAILPIIILSNGSAYGIHVLSAIRQRQQNNPDADNNQNILAALKYVALPVALAALTTLVGFLSFLSSPLSLFKEFGVEAAIGIIFSLVLALIFIPAVASFFPPKTKAAGEDAAKAKSHWLDRLMGKWARLVDSHYKLIVGATLAVVIAAIPGIFRLQSGLDMMGFFAKDSGIAQADQVMNDHFGGSQPVFVAVTAESVKNPIVLQKINEVTRELRANPNLHQINSVSSIVAELNYYIDDNYLIPPNQDAVGNLWLMVDGNESLSQMISSDNKSAMIVGRTSQLSTGITKKLIADIDSYYERDNSFVALSVNSDWSDKTILWNQMAKEIAHQLTLISKYYLTDKPFDEVKAGTIIRTYIGNIKEELTATLTIAEKEKLAAEYFNSDDCDLLVEDEEVKKQLVSIAVKGVSGEEIERFWSDALSDLAASDPDGLTMAAGSLEDIFARGALRQQSANLLANLQNEGLLLDMPKLMAREVQGELFRIHNATWPVTADFYKSFTGHEADKEQVVTYQVEQTGMHQVTVAISDKLTESQIYSLALSLVLVFLALLIQLRSPKRAALALIPVLFTIVFMFGFLGYCHINIDILTALIASLAVGIGVDYSIHISFALNRAAKEGVSISDQLMQAVGGSGQAIIINASAVVAGFLVIVASRMPVLRVFGGLVAMAIALSALGALTILPAIFHLGKK